MSAKNSLFNKMPPEKYVLEAKSHLGISGAVSMGDGKALIGNRGMTSMCQQILSYVPELGLFLMPIKTCFFLAVDKY